MSSNTVKIMISSVVLFAFAWLNSITAQSNNITEGFSVGSKESYGNYGDVSLYDGSLNFSLPLLSMKGRGSVSYSPNLRISAEWEIDTQFDDDGGQGDPHYNNYISYKGTNANGINYRNPVVGYGPGVLVFKRDGGIFGTSSTLTRVYFYSAGGERIEFRDNQFQGQRKTVWTNRGKYFVSNDGSAATFISDTDISDNPNCINLSSSQCYQNMPNPYPSGYLKFANGIEYRIDNGAVTSIRDKDGNTMQFSYYPSGQVWNGVAMAGQIETATDTHGRIIEFQYNVSDVEPYGVCDKIIYKGFAGETRIIRVSKKQMSNVLQSGEVMPVMGTDLFPDAVDNNYCTPDGGDKCHNDTYNVSVGNPLLISSVSLPDGKSYQFKYNRYGELARVEIPTGGIIEYDHFGAGGDIGGFVRGDVWEGISSYFYRRIAERRTFREGNVLEKKETYSFGSGVCSNECGQPWNQRTDVTVQTFDGQSQARMLASKHYFYGSVGGSFNFNGDYPIWRTGKEYKTESLDINNNVLKRTEIDWQQRVYVPWWNAGCTFQCPPLDASPAVDPRAVEVRNIDVITNQISKTRYGYDEFNNQTDIWEYDFGQGQAGALLRYAHVDYLRGFYIDNYYASSPHLRRLPERQWISSDEQGNTKASLTEYEYDNYNSDINHAPLISRSNVVGHNSTSHGTNNTQRGNVTKIKTYENAQNQTGVISAYTQFDILGNVTKTINANGNVSTIDYADNFGSPDGEARLNSSPGQLNGQSTFAYATRSTNTLGWLSGYSQRDYFTGAVVNSEDINGVISKAIYDSVDRPIQTVSAVGTTYESQSNTVYDDANRRIEGKNDLNVLNDNLIKVESFYDSLGRTFETRKYEANGYIVTKTEFDALSRVKRKTNPYRPLQSEQPVWSESFYDDLSRVIRVKTSDNAEFIAVYSGNTVVMTDQSGKQKRSITNGLGRLIREDEPNGGGQLDFNGTPAQSTNYQYDVLGNLIQVNQGIQTRTYSYNSLSRLQSATTPESGTINYTYDLNGNLTSTTDARNIVTTYTYDALSRLLTKTYNDTTPPVSYIYDDASIQFSKGKMTKVSSSVSTNENLAFDILGRTLTYRQTTDGQSYNTSYVYNLSGALIEQTYPSGRIVKNALDNDGHLSQVQSKANTNGVFRNYADRFVYNASEIASSLRFGNGKFLTIQFNNRLQPIQIGLGSSVGNTGLLKLNYDYGATNNNGNILSQQITINQNNQNPLVLNQSYVYDSLNRLKSATETSGGTQTWKQTYTFDRYGNRNFDPINTTTLGSCLQAQCNPTVDITNNRFTTGQNYVYDLSGNLIQDAEGRSFVYDAENKQKSVSNSSGTIGQYFFDGVGKRVKKVSNTETTIFVYDVGGKLIAEYSTQTNQNPKVNYLTADNLGTPRIKTDQTGQVISRSDYLPYGEELYTPQRAQALGYVQDNLKQGFTGYINDDETGLDFAQARMYANRLGRFTSVDPMSASANTANPQTINRYIYSLNNPLTLVDRTGAVPNYSYYVYFRAFAPFDYFGGFGTNAFVGDGDERGFSIDRKASYRLSAISTAQRSGGTFDPVYTRAERASLSTNVYTGYNAFSEGYVGGDYSGYADKGLGPINAYSDFNLSGNDDAVIYDIFPFNTAPDIDLNVHWNTTFSNDASITYGVGAEFLNITGGASGDGFPAAESFIYDDHGNGIMLGVYAPGNIPGPDPELRLWGNNHRPMINFDVTILVVNGVFKGVIEDGELVSIADWNERYTGQDPREPEPRPP